MNASPRLSDAAIAGRVHPRTGVPIVPIGFVGGRPVWPIMGGSGDEDDANEDGKSTEDESDDDKKGSEGSDKSEEGKEDDDKSKGDPQAKIEDLEAEKNRHFKRRKEAEDAADQLRKELDELKSKDTPELDRLKTTVAEQETKITGLETSLHEARLQNAFLQDNTYAWHNPSRALALADLSEVDIDSDGKVHGLRKALDSLAKSDAYLLKPEGKQESTENKGKTGDSPKGKPTPKEAKDAERQKLLDKYPGLRR